MLLFCAAVIRNFPPDLTVGVHGSLRDSISFKISRTILSIRIDFSCNLDDVDFFPLTSSFLSLFSSFLGSVPRVRFPIGITVIFIFNNSFSTTLQITRIYPAILFYFIFFALRLNHKIHPVTCSILLVK